MPEKTKRNKDFKIPAQAPDEQTPEDHLKDDWSRDQQEKSYYYDDAYGYEIYNPEEDDDDEEENN